MNSCALWKLLLSIMWFVSILRRLVTCFRLFLKIRRRWRPSCSTTALKRQTGSLGERVRTWRSEKSPTGFLIYRWDKPTVFFICDNLWTMWWKIISKLYCASCGKQTDETKARSLATKANSQTQGAQINGWTSPDAQQVPGGEWVKLTLIY